MEDKGLKLTKAQSEQVGEITAKVINGWMLTKHEFIIALQQGLYEFPVSKADEAYESLKASHYNSPTRQGYLCSKHRNQTLEETTSEDGLKHRTLCGWGIHYDDTELQYLTEENRGYLVDMCHHYGIVIPY